jgi:hypothetical protein
VPPTWDRVASELRSYREQQERTWGKVDSSTLGRYLDDAADSQERKQVEAALAEHPELRKLTDLVREVLADFEPAASPSPSPVTVPQPTPAVLAFQPRRQRFWRAAREYVALAAAACLLMALGIGLIRNGLGRSTPKSDDNLLAMNATAKVRPSSALEDDLPRSEPGKDRVVRTTSTPLQALERQVVSLTEKGQVDRAVQVASRISEAAKKAKEQQNPYFGESLARIGDVWSQHGYYQEAAPVYQQAHVLYQKAYGNDHPETKQVTSNLANVYQAALTAEVGNASGPYRVTHPLAQIPFKTADIYPRKDVEQERKSALALREQLTRRESASLQQEVTPVLLQAMKDARNPIERTGYIYALGQIGPAAQEALPVLCDCARQPKNELEQQAALLALGEIGPGEPEVVIPHLLEVLRTGAEKTRQCAAEALVSLGTRGRAALEHERNESVKDREPAYAISVARLLNRARTEQSVGVCDCCQLFTPYTLHQARADVADLAKQHIPVYVETERTPPTGPLADVAERARVIGTPGVYVLLIQKPAPKVEVHVAEPLRARLKPDALRQRIETVWKQKGPDAALEQTVSFLGELKQ